MRKNAVVISIGCAGLLIAGFLLLKSDYSTFLTWWLAVLVIGLAFLPLTSLFFKSFADRGWIFSKVLGIAAGGYLMFALCAAGAVPFNGSMCILCVLIAAVICFCASFLIARRKRVTSGQTAPEISFELIVFEEFLFILFFLIWAYFTGFKPEALSTEKFMDYGFMQTMMRSDMLPAPDMWYAGETINYYHGGQYYAVFLTKLTATRVEITYNLAKALIAAFAFTMPFSIVRHLYDAKNGTQGTKHGAAVAAGLFGGAAVSLAGNMHYVLYGLFGSTLKLSGYEDYWFPSSTRYIGHNPSNGDACIHEFPSYSYVLGDLHAHVVNIIFVLLFIGLVYAWLRGRENERIREEVSVKSVSGIIISTLKDPYIWILGFLIGIYKWTNYWDFIIYFTVALIAFVLQAIRQNREPALVSAVRIIIRFIVMLAVSVAAALPFTLTFDSMFQGIALSTNHSALYQLAVLWGLPVICVAILFVYVLKGTIRHESDLVFHEKTSPVKRFISGMTLSDMTALMLGICAIGLIIIPELVYIKDIYSDGYSRSNTMFKLTYQAYIMFGMSMIYSLFRIFSDAKKLVSEIISAVLLTAFLATCLYFPYSLECWFGNVMDVRAYKGLDADAFLATTIPEDAGGIYWLQDNVQGSPVVLEANGTSYTQYCRVSAMTGLPTVSGWYTHEWLWRNRVGELNNRNDDVEQFYTSGDEEAVRALIDKYDIEYVFVGKYEREKFPELNEAVLKGLGTIVYSGTGENPTYIIKVGG
ncbi:MAG: hypothetical protein IKR00_04390 [Lachnospiraceae bacterium]|nr:hypothetical protein [Lachnospiraceae bacterium]